MAAKTLGELVDSTLDALAEMGDVEVPEPDPGAKSTQDAELRKSFQEFLERLKSELPTGRFEDASEDEAAEEDQDAENEREELRSRLELLESKSDAQPLQTMDPLLVDEEVPAHAAPRWQDAP